MSAGRDLLVGRIDQRARVAGGEVVEPGVVGVEELAGVEPGRRGHRAPGRGAVVVGEVRGVAGVAGDAVVPAGGARHRGQDEQRLELAQRHVRVGRAVGQRAVGDAAAHREAARAAAVEGVQERELGETGERLVELGVGGAQPRFRSLGEQRPQRGVELAVARVQPVVELAAARIGLERLRPRPGHRRGRRRHVGMQARRPPPPASRRRGRSSRRRRAGSPAGRSRRRGSGAAGRRGRRRRRTRARSARARPRGSPRARRAARRRCPRAARGPCARGRGRRSARTSPPARRRSTPAPVAPASAGTHSTPSAPAGTLGGQIVQQLVHVGAGGRRTGGLDRPELVPEPAVGAAREPAGVLEQPAAGVGVRVHLGDARRGRARAPGQPRTPAPPCPSRRRPRRARPRRRRAWPPSRRRSRARPWWTRRGPRPRAARARRGRAPCPTGRTGASEPGSTPNASQASPDQSPVCRSSSIVDDAFDGSTATSPDARQATNEPGSRNQRAAACWSARWAASQAILAATWPGSRLQPVRSRRRSGSSRPAAASHSAPARRSIQISAGPVGSPSAPAGTEPVELRAERDRAQRPVADVAAHLGQRLRDGAEPLAADPARPSRGAGRRAVWGT